MKRKTLPRCPRCGKHPTTYRETVTVGWWFEVAGATITDAGSGDDAVHGPPVSAYCECGHEWTLRGVSQITDLPLDDEQFRNDLAAERAQSR